MDLAGKAEHIRDVLGNYAPEEQRRLLQELFDSVPVHGRRSIANAEDHVKIFRRLLFLALFLRTRAIRRRRRIMALHFVPSHGTGFLHKFRKKWSGAPGNIAHAYPIYRIAHARFW